MLHDLLNNTSEKMLEKNSSYDYVYLVNPQKVRYYERIVVFSRIHTWMDNMLS